MHVRKGPRGERRLLELYRALDGGGRETLLAFAEFLAQRATAAGPAPEGPSGPEPEPEPLPRPEGETVIAAIKRLSRTYPMLDRGRMLGETSALVAQHVMQGRPAAEVIDELEALFRAHYERMRGG